MAKEEERQKMKEVTAYSLDDTKKIAVALSGLLRKGDIIAFNGDLGVGKTAFIRFLIQDFLPFEEVPSPTFTLLQTYETDFLPIYHFDLYRLDKPEDAFELGIEDAFFEGISLVEWPEKMKRLFPYKKALVIDISCKGNTRYFNFHSENPSWIERLQHWNI